jgi:type VI secretion system VasD/TssJ family lipoprotein
MEMRKVIAAGFLAALAAGCGGPTKIELLGSHELNVNPEGESTPVKVRVYKLKDSQKFVQCAFEDLWVDDRKALGEDRLEDPLLFTVIPGGQPIPVDLGEPGGDVRFIGIMALISKKPDGEADGRRALIPAEAANGSTFELSGYKILQR